MAEQKQTESTSSPQSETKNNPVVDLFNNMSENTLFRSPLVADSFKPPYNPDDLWQRRGSYKVYEDMLNDDQVSVCLQLKKDLVLGDGGMFVPGDDGQDEIIDDLETAFFEDYEGDFIESLEEICSGYEFGNSITEKVFKLRDGGKLGLKQLLTRHPDSWRLHQDNYGRVIKYEQVTVEGSKDINPKALTHYVNKPRFQNPYGRSDLRQAYIAYFTKVEIVKYMAIFMEKAASPTPVGKFDKNAPQSAVDKIFEALKKFQAKTALVIPKDIEVEFLEAKNNGEVYIKAINLFNMFIGRALFVPDLVGFTGGETGGGSLSLGKEQMNLFFKHILRRRAQLEAIVNKQYVWPIVQYNFGFVKNYPKFKFKPLDDMAAIDLAKVWLEAVKGKTYKPNPEEINHFRKLVKFPDSELVEFSPPPMDPLNPNNPMMPGQKPGEEPELDEDGKPVPPKPGDEKPEDPKDPKAIAKTNEEDEKEKAFLKKLPEGDYHKKVDFKAIETKLKDYDQSVMSDVRPIVKKILMDLMDQVERKKILSSQNAERIDSLSLKYKKELKQILKNSFTQLFNDAQSQAANEVEKSNFAKPLMSQDFLDMIEQETFKFVGDYEYGILKRTRNELIAAIKDGKSLNSVVGILDVDLKEMSDVAIERYARTKHTEVMNNARVEFFDSTGVVTGYQYSAILDDTTSDICKALDGKKFDAGDEPIPPMHFNCRSLLIPITKYEEFTPTERVGGMPVSEYIEENKGSGFSTK